MISQKLIRPGEKLPLKLTAAQRTLILEGVSFLGDEYVDAVGGTPPGQPIMLTPNELENFGGFIAAQANHTKDRKRQKKLDTVFHKIEALLDIYTDGKPAKTVDVEGTKNSDALAEQANEIAKWTAEAIVFAAQVRITNKNLDYFYLAPDELQVLELVPTLAKKVKTKLAKDPCSLTFVEVAGLVVDLAMNFLDQPAEKRAAALFVAEQLIDHLQTAIDAGPTPMIRKDKKPKPKAATNTVYQFKITLRNSQPPIWRRIQITDCTLDKLHEHIQTAMGWTNSHLHQFEINGQRYADPRLMEETFDDMECQDSTTTLISETIPKKGKKFRFDYEYDFGDSWHHEICFEGSLVPKPGQKYPLCVEGQRACPPEDVGGIGGFYELVEALADPEHERHEELLEWNGPFDPDDFDAGKATKAMKKGLPDWRR